MKLRHYIFVFMASMAGSFFMASCLNEDNKIPPNCYDGILNNGEERLDCGGPNCVECDHCTNGRIDFDRGETWVDCGGECAPCPQCANGIKDGDETGIDCGGSCGGCDLLCNDGLLNGNENQIDCQNDLPGQDEDCPFCPTCVDGIMNGQEVGIDCGGPTCAPCCSSGNCRNGLIDGNEFWIDCGGKTCPDCRDTLGWKINNLADYTPSFLPIPADYDGQILSWEMSPSFAGAIFNMQLTRPLVGWLNNQTFTLNPASAADNVIAYTDPNNVTYSTGLPGGTATVTLVKYATVVVPNDNTDGCHKPAGTYYFFRGAFVATLAAIDGSTRQVQNGIFQITFVQ